MPVSQHDLSFQQVNVESSKLTVVTNIWFSLICLINIKAINKGCYKNYQYPNQHRQRAIIKIDHDYFSLIIYY